MTEGWLPPDTSLDDLKVRIRETYSNPNVRKIHQVVLKEGPQAFRIATLLEVVNRESGNFHHYSLKIDHIDKRRGGWFAKPARSIRLDGDSPDEVERLYRFLHALYQNNLSSGMGELHVIRSEDYAKLEKVLEALPNLASTDKLQLVKTILAQFEASSSHVADFVSAFQNSNVETLKHIAVASRMVEYRQAYAELETLIQDASTPEKRLQDHLTNNPWMFGSEYSELLPRRSWTRDDRLDYMLRRTVDDFLEIIEIKTPFRDALFIYDDSHDSFYPSSKLSPILGQVVRYIEEVERARDSILAKDGCDTLKIRARAILGRDGPPEHQVALHNLNAHLHRIEIITFDQLLRIAARVIAVFEAEKAEGEATENDDGDTAF
jgi:Domain of unknown function (DUF4263)